MSKNKKLTPEQSRKRSGRRLKRRIIQLVLLIVIGGGSYLILNPQAITDPVRRAQLEQVKEKVMGASVDESEEVSSEEKSKVGTVLGEAFDKSKSYIEHAFKTVKIPKKLTGTNEEVVIEEVVDNFSDELKQLPAEQVKKIKIQLCQDVIDEAMLACE